MQTNSQSFIRSVSKCVSDPRLLSNASFIEKLKSNEPPHVDDGDVIDLMRSTHKLCTKHGVKHGSHLMSAHEYFRHLCEKTISALNESETMQRRVINEAMSIEHIDSLLTCIDIKRHSHIFGCMALTLRRCTLLIGDFNSYAKVLYTLACLANRHRTLFVRPDEDDAQRMRRDLDVMLSSVLKLIDKYRMYASMNEVSCRHLLHALALLQCDVESPINALHASSNILHYIETRIDFSKLGAAQLRELIPGLLHYHSFLRKLLTFLCDPNHLGVEGYRDMRDLLHILDALHLLTAYDQHTKQWNAFLLAETENQTLFLDAVRSIIRQVHQRMTTTPVQSVNDVAYLLSCLCKGSFDDAALVHAIDDYVLTQKDTLSSSATVELFGSCLWCHAVNDIAFARNQVFEVCVSGLSQCLDGGNDAEFSLDMQDIEALIRASYAMVILCANGHLKRENLKLLAEFYGKLWSLIERDDDSCWLPQLRDLRHTKYKHFVGSLLRCHEGLKLLNESHGCQIAELNASVVDSLRSSFYDRSDYKGSRIEKCIIDVLHSEYKRNVLWVDKLEHIQRNVLLSNKVVECDIVLHLKSEEQTSRNNIVVDICGPHHYLTLSTTQQNGKSKFTKWMLQTLGYKVYVIDARDFKQINYAQIIKDVERLLCI